jgi:hypothetical protein
LSVSGTLNVVSPHIEYILTRGFDADTGAVVVKKVGLEHVFIIAANCFL